MARASTQELQDRLEEILDEFTGRISFAEAVGTLEIVKSNLTAKQDNDEDDEPWRADG